MSCNGCRTNVENTLNNINGVLNATVNLKEEKATIEMESHIPIEKLQQEFLNAGLHYTISIVDPNEKHTPKVTVKPVDGNGVFYCPMHCEGNKTYNKMGDCPVCGMDLVEQPKLTEDSQYTCPMHPEVVKDSPGDCPVCGMDLVPTTPEKKRRKQNVRSFVKKNETIYCFCTSCFYHFYVNAFTIKSITKINVASLLGLVAIHFNTTHCILYLLDVL